MYLSDAIPPRMYDMIKAHTPEKNYPMKLVVSTIGTANYGLSEYLVKIIQNTLNKNQEFPSLRRRSQDMDNCIGRSPGIVRCCQPLPISSNQGIDWSIDWPAESRPGKPTEGNETEDQRDKRIARTMPFDVLFLVRWSNSRAGKQRSNRSLTDGDHGRELPATPRRSCDRWCPTPTAPDRAQDPQKIRWW